MTRTIAGLVFTTLLMTGAASASSFVTPQPMTAKLGPSMIALGEPASPGKQPDSTDSLARALDWSPLNYPAPVGIAGTGGGQGEAGGEGFVQISPSIIVMGMPEPAVSYEHVAAVDGADDGVPVQRNIFGPGPTVIRGGVVDNSGAPAEQTPTEAERSMETAAGKPDDAPSAPPPSDRPLPPNGLAGSDWRPSE